MVSDNSAYKKKQTTVAVVTPASVCGNWFPSDFKQKLCGTASTDQRNSQGLNHRSVPLDVIYTEVRLNLWQKDVGSRVYLTAQEIISRLFDSLQNQL